MRAVVMERPGGTDVLALRTVPAPVRTGAELLVKVVAAGINPIDAKTRAGRGASNAISGYPAVLGHDFSGVVVESPYEAHPLQPGDEVYGMVPVPRFSGSYAEYITVPSLSVAPKPTRLSHVEAAAVPLAALTAWGVVVDVAKAHEGQRILIHAASGGVGHFAVQFASYFGAHVIATGSARNAGFLRDLGAAEVIDYRFAPFERRVAEVDAVVDLVGNLHDDTGRRSLRTLRRGGLIINVPTGSWPEFRADVQAAGMRGTGYKVAPDGARLAVISRLLQSGDVKVYVDRVFDLTEAAAAHDALEQGHTRGKIVLKVCDG
jgi:NADPH:quinone reductase-like Zn-dependent oxidoreductase